MPFLKRILVSPWVWAVLLILPPTLVPAIDLTVSSWFFDPAIKAFPARTQTWAEWVRKEWPYYMFSLAAAVPLIWAYGAAFKRPVLGLTKMPALFLILSLALGPGLAVNTVLKDHWGRPRPTTISQFGGSFDYRPPLMPGGPCNKNCAFPSGHSSLAFWLVAPALLTPARWRKKAVTAGVVAGLAVGLVRIAEGGHFLSDVLYAGLITVGITYILYLLLITPSIPRVIEHSDS